VNGDDRIERVRRSAAELSEDPLEARFRALERG
jgi:hypothetical protein